MFGRATIRLGIGPHSSLPYLKCVTVKLENFKNVTDFNGILHVRLHNACRLYRYVAAYRRYESYRTVTIQGLRINDQTHIDERPARDALCQLQCCKPLYTNNANRSIVSLVRTFCKSRFYSATCSCIVFHTHRDKRLNYRAKSTQCSVLHKLILACTCI